MKSFIWYELALWKLQMVFGVFDSEDVRPDAATHAIVPIGYVLNHDVVLVNLHQNLPMKLLLDFFFFNQSVLTHFVPQTRLSHFERNIASVRERETLVLD